MSFSSALRRVPFRSSGKPNILYNSVFNSSENNFIDVLRYSLKREGVLLLNIMFFT